MIKPFHWRVGTKSKESRVLAAICIHMFTATVSTTARSKVYICIYRMIIER